MAKIQLQDVSLHFPGPERQRRPQDPPADETGGVNALDHVDLTVPNGRLYMLIGPSGCGKSSLLRVVAGLENRHTGQVLYDGEDMRNIRAGDRYIGMVFQNYALYPNFNNEGNLSFFFRLRKTPNEETRKRIEYASELMGIGFKELLPRRPGSISGGEQQRVAVARAIVRSPRLLLFDEPLSNLDARLRVQTRLEIKRLLRRFSITTLYVTHDQTEAAALADMIVVMRSGRIEQVGTYRQLAEDPVNVFVAGFVGLPPMDLLAGGSVSGGKLVLDELPIPLSQRIASLAAEGQAVTLGMRRETVRVSTGTPPANGIQLPAEVEAFEPDFVHRLQVVHVRTGRFAYSALCPMDVGLGIGQRVRVDLDPEQLYLFDTVTGRRL